MARDDDEPLADEREWQEIVENFGERAVLEPDDEPLVDVTPRVLEPDDVEEPVAVRDQVPADDEFVPPEPPPIPRPPADRLAAWLGVFGVPAVVLFCIVLGISVPTWIGLLMAAGFVGGFCYLVVRMSDEPRPPWDDGAVL
ncbi:hypothetical protein [Nocardioides pelophilus]|uniref:hypothetical protein n=1 Tax=Nocardioides pelophilus TaxID=2172019 RepID=UPI001602AB89|nr:hypothetical protein [Nocardioides pelophilus]